MLRSCWFACIVLAGVSPVLSQPASEKDAPPIDGEEHPPAMTPVFIRARQADGYLPPGDLKEFMKTSPDSAIYQRYLSGRSMSMYGDICGGVGAGGLLCGLLSEPMNTPAIVIGAATTVTGILLELSGNSKMRHAEEDYRRRYGGTPAAGRVIPSTLHQTLFSVSLSF